jgi:VWFA-related protein
MGRFYPPRLSAGVGLSILLSAALAQAPQEPLLRVTVNLVQIQAVVTERTGAHITNLKAGDFRVFQDGKEQKVTHCTYIPTGRPAASKPAPTDRAQPAEGPLPPAKLTSQQVRRTIAIVVDDLDFCQGTFEEFAEVRRALRKYVTGQMRPGDMVAILRTAGDVGALQQFTSDKPKLLAAADRIGYFTSGNGFCATDSLELQRRLITFAQGLGTLPGQKSIVLFTSGDPFSRLDPYSLWLHDRLLDATSRAAVTVYVIDRAGLPTISVTAAQRIRGGNDNPRSDALAQVVNQQLSGTRQVNLAAHAGMSFLARSTGGLFLSNTSDLGAMLRTATNDMQGYYLLGYTPEASTFDPVTGQRRFHRISVRVQRPGLTVRTQAGFLGVEDRPAPPAGSTNAVLASLVSPFGSPDIELGMSSVFFNDAARGSFITTLVNVKAGDLSFREEAGERVAEGDVAVMLFGDNGEPVERTAIAFQAKLDPASYETAIKNGFLYTLQLPAKKPGPYDVRVAVRDKATAKIGTATQFVQVPDLQPGHMALSSIMLQPTTAGTRPDESAPDLRGSVALRIFHPGDTMTYGYQVLNPKLDADLKQPKVVAQVRLYRDGKEFFVGKPAPVDAGSDVQRLSAGGDIKIGPEMPPGEYMLETSVTDLLAGKNPSAVKQLVDFRVVP